MANPRQRKKTKTPSSKVSRIQKNRKNISFAGVHPIVKTTWDAKQTLRQNYSKMGLVASLGGYAGGSIVTDSIKENIEVEWRTLEPLEKIPEKETIEGNILTDERALRIGTKMNLKDQVLPYKNSENAVISQLEVEAQKSAPVLVHQSEQEALVFEKLLAKHQLDFESMARDIKLNKYQLSAGQLRKKAKKIISREILVTVK